MDRRTDGHALVICIHSPPTPGAGQGIAVEMSGVLTFELSLQCGNIPGICVIQAKRAVQGNNNRLRGKTAMVLPADCPPSVGVIAGD